MVYIAPDGSVHQNPPWSLNRLVGLFWGFINFIMFFFKTLFNFEGGSTSNNRSGSRGGSGGGSGYGGGGPGSGPGTGPRNRPIGRIRTMEHCDIPGGG